MGNREQYKMMFHVCFASAVCMYFQTLMVRTKQASYKDGSHWIKFKSPFGTQQGVKRHLMKWGTEIKSDTAVLKAPEHSTLSFFIKKIKSVIKLAVLSLHT